NWRNLDSLRCALASDVRTGAHSRELIRTRDSQLCPRFQDSGCSNANIVILLQRGANHAFQFLVLEDFPPFLIAKRSGFSLGSFFRRQSPVCVWNGDDWPLVI